MNAQAAINNGIITTTETGHPSHTFRICDRVPHGFGVWSIGEHMGTGEYLPFCESISKEKPFDINPDTLIAVKLPPEQVEILRTVAVCHGGTVAEMRHALRRKRFYSICPPELIEQAIEILEQITD